ncbi:MAG: thiamine-phosphate kinase, partial [archaeon]|nr:thiamine-phosphate kinase [archaeon]
MNKSVKNVSDIGEKGLIGIISEILGGLGTELLSGEDDAVAVSLKSLKSTTLVINNDMLVSTTDVPRQMSLFEAGKKAVVMTVSDILVKGAIPRWGLVSLGIPADLTLEGINGFMGMIKGLKKGFDNFETKYIGGDLNRSNEIIISCTIFGDSLNGNIIPRSGAKVDDVIIATDKFGKTGCGLAILLNNLEAKNITEEQRKSFTQAVLHPNTPKEHGRLLLQMYWATSSADSSDGIQKTITEICKSSKVGAELKWNELPIAEGVDQFAEETGLDIMNLVLRAGEEFLHIFTVPEAYYITVKNYFSGKNMPCYKIGVITDEEKGINLILEDGKKIDLNQYYSGYDHFIIEGKEVFPEEKSIDDYKEILDEDVFIKEVDEIYEMPGYFQYPGACGLTSILMAFRPESRRIAPLLNDIWNKIKTIFRDPFPENDEYNWQRVLEWLLFETTRNKKLQELLDEGFGPVFKEAMLPDLENRIMMENPSEKWQKISPKKQMTMKLDLSGMNKKWIMRRVEVWKEDFELKILAYLFGSKFIPWEKTEDGTGAVFFTSKEPMGDKISYQEKVEFLESLINSFQNSVALFNATIHWVAVKKIEKIEGTESEYLVRYMDPASAEESER